MSTSSPRGSEGVGQLSTRRTSGLPTERWTTARMVASMAIVTPLFPRLPRNLRGPYAASPTAPLGAALGPSLDQSPRSPMAAAPPATFPRPRPPFPAHLHAPH